MANERQRLAKKRFRLVHPALQERTAEGKEDFAAGKKRMRVEDGGGSPVKKKTRNTEVVADKVGKKKHPLRVSGMKPGEGCFVCKSRDHIAKECPQKAAQDRKKICLLCRQWGHTLKKCPTESSRESRFCYNCGEKGHRLAECKKPLKDGGASFAQCFLCKQTGHLSKDCPTNAQGIYPKGGSCKICGGVTHLAKDCPNKDKAKAGPGHTKLKISTKGTLASDARKRTVFQSGDDLEDDFVGADLGNLNYGSDQENVDNKPAVALKGSSEPSKKVGKDRPAKPLRPGAVNGSSSKVVKF